MENSWPMKCGPFTQSIASSTSQEPRNQREMDYFYPLPANNSISAGHGKMQDPMGPNVNLASYKQASADLGNSFLALLSAPPSLLQCDFNGQSSLRSFITASGKLPFDGGAVTNASVGRDVPPIVNGVLSECQSNRNILKEASQILSSRGVVKSNCSGKYVLHDSVESLNLSLHSSDLAKAVINQLVSGTEMSKDFSSTKGNWPSTSRGPAAQIPSSSLPLQSSVCTKECPRVICLGASGHLLISNTGLLGVICLCHNFHTSVAKFCEHLGLCDVNPGDAVHMESGETIAQWRKLYFQKFGIRVPDDQTGWDWSEAVPADLVKSSVSVSNMPNNSDLAKLVGSSGSLKKSGLPLESNVLPKNGHTDQNFMVDAFRNVERNIGRGNANFPLKGLINPWESNNHAVADNVIMECQKFRCSPCPDFVGRKPDGGLQPTSDYVESFLKFRDLSVTKPTQNSRMSIDYYDVGKIKIGRDDAIRERVTISSNIELRLGQPCQQSQSSDIYVPSVSGPKLLDTFVAQPKSLLLEQMTNNASNCGERVASMQYFQCSANPANVPARNVRNLNLGRHAFGISYVTDTIKLDKFDGNVTRSSMVPSLTNVNIPHERNANSKTNNHVAIGDQIIPKSFCSESYSAKSDQICVPRTVNGSERYLDVSELGFFRVNDKGKGVGCAADGSCAPEGSESNIPKQLESCGSFSGSIVGSRDPCSSAIHDRSHCAPQSCGVLPDVFDAINFFNHPEKVISLGNNKHTDNHFLTSKDLPNLATSASMSGMAPAVSKLAGTGVNPYLLDDNMRFLALGQILELSKQQHAMDQKTTTLGSFSIVNPFVEPSKFVEQTPGPCVTCQRGTSEMAMLSTSPGAYARLGVHTEKSGPVTDLNNACEFSTWMGGNLSRSREIDMQCKFPHGPPPTKELPLRSDHISSSIELGKCYQEVSGAYSQDRCNCAAHTKCSSRYCESRIGNTQNTLKVHVGTVNCETSLLVASEFVKDGTGVKEKTISSDRRAKMNGEVLKSNVCHSSEWKDVPSKFKGVSNVKYSDQSAEDLSDGRELKGPLRDTNTKCSYGTVKIHEPLKEQEMSNFSSGCSAAAVTQASIQGNNIDSSIANAGMTRYLNNHVVDEGSGIDKCCTSDDAFESEKSTEFVGSKCETDLRKEGSSKDINDRQSRSLLDELKLLNSLTWKKGRKQICSRLAVHGTINLKKVERDVKTGKRKRARKLKMLVSQCPAAGPSVHCGRAKGMAPLSCSSEDLEMLNPYIQETHVSGACPLQHRTTHGRSSLSLSKKVYRKTDHLMIYSDTDGEGDCQIKSNGNTNLCKIHEFSGVKELRRAWSPDCVRKSQMKEPTHGHTKDSLSCSLVGSTKAVSSCEPNIFSRQARPVVCGRFGEICSERTGDVSRPAKIVPLSRILKTSRRGTVPKNSEWKQTFLDELKKSSCINDVGDKGFYNMKNGEESVIHHSTFCNETSIDPSVEKDEKMCTNGDKQFDENAMLDKEIDHKRKKNCSALSRSFRTKFKEKRKRCLSELAENEQKSSSKSLSPEMICKCIPKVKTTRTAVDKHNVCASCKVNSEKLNQDHKSLSVMGSDAFCCVCGGSDNDEINCLLECSLCYIKVHQACYGVSRVPKGPWYCRPCRTNSRDIVCVLCGYGGGAMTRALHSRTIVKGLLEAWNVETENRQNSAVLPSEIMEDLNMSHSSESLLESSRFSVLRPVNIKPSATAAWKVDFLNQLEIYQKSSYSCSNVKVHNSITAGALDPTVKQWIHMVCGLWTPGTRCPNVDTMSAFDVSGASRPKANVVCSICNRPGGSCIQCRVVNCSVKFHPWCAHQKGLLQSEVEGVENESVGFYGRCVLHATHLLCESGCDPNDFEVDCSIEKEFTCARTEGYKGRKRDGFWHNLHGQSRGKTACLVPQEQLNAWVHINGMRLSTNGLAKLPVSDVDFNSRKEYVRNKQVKGRKHLVVYKSGIHALGLYTSRFISRGEMVVEYVGEIVGLRVADKREIEYQSGRKLQYKSACYFFRIDKEHIIDATSKGGIARFVNHSCMPNCVAEVISLRNEKKVVFFAERDIYPGEEITYDYHFNHEDEGKKIPCFCNSENCRRYLN